MTAFTLIDYSQATYPNNPCQIGISTDQELRQAFHCLRRREPSLYDLVSSSGDSLTIGVTQRLGCVMFMNAEGEPPYLWARGCSDDEENVVEFEYGGTPTPIPLSRCLPLRKVIDIAAHYLLNERLPAHIEWEED